ncbi:MAG: hypothetical protein K2J62_01955 [Bacteroidales bacterium]|nr:hypothetical protein [Bacteroidales bacterium]
MDRMGAKRFSMEVMAAFTVLAWSCGGPVELDRPIRDTGRTEQGGSEEQKKQKSLYVTGVEYAEGYDWRPDLGCSADNCKVFLMKDGTRIMEVDVGYSACISADADMHRCIEGHLYTDFSTDMETVIKRDGAELFRYFGREMIARMVVRDDGIYTLGQPRSGSGWTYRKNGEILLHKGSGNLVSGLYEDLGKLYFSYEDYIGTPSGTVTRYYMVENTIPTAIQTTDDIIKIDDIRMIEGTLYYTAQLRNISPTVLFCGPDCRSYEMGSGTSMRNCRIIYSSGEIFTHGEVYVGGRYEDWFWKGTERISRATYPLKAIGWCSDPDYIYYAASTTASGAGSAIFDGHEIVSQPVHYDFLYANAIGADAGRCCAGLVSNLAGNRPALWFDGKITDYGFNGAFTSVSYW